MLWRDGSGERRRGVTVAKLRSLLDSFEPGDVVEVNGVGNLSVSRSEEQASSEEQVGHIDLGAREEAVVYGPDPAEPTRRRA